MLTPTLAWAHSAIPGASCWEAERRMDVVGKRLGLSHLLQPEGLGGLPWHLSTAQGDHASSDLSLVQSPALYASVSLAGRALPIAAHSTCSWGVPAVSPRALSLEKGGRWQWGCSQPGSMGLPAAQTKFSCLGCHLMGLCVHGGQGVCRCVRAHRDVQLPHLQPPVAPVLCCQGVDPPQAWDCFGRVRPCCSFGTTR